MFHLGGVFLLLMMGPSQLDETDDEEEEESDGNCNLCGEMGRDKLSPQIWSATENERH